MHRCLEGAAAHRDSAPDPSLPFFCLSIMRSQKQTELLRAAVRVLAMVEVEVELQEGSELEARSSGDALDYLLLGDCARVYGMGHLCP